MCGRVGLSWLWFDMVGVVVAMVFGMVLVD